MCEYSFRIPQFVITGKPARVLVRTSCGAAGGAFVQWAEAVGIASWLVGAWVCWGLSGVCGNSDHEGNLQSVRSSCPIHTK